MARDSWDYNQQRPTWSRPEWSNSARSEKGRKGPKGGGKGKGQKQRGKGNIEFVPARIQGRSYVELGEPGSWEHFDQNDNTVIGTQHDTS